MSPNISEAFGQDNKFFTSANKNEASRQDNLFLCSKIEKILGVVKCKCLGTIWKVKSVS